MNRFNPKKLLHSKWTAVSPQNKEKHFMVVKLHWDEDKQVVLQFELEAVMTKNCYLLEPSELKDSQVWQQGWK